MNIPLFFGVFAKISDILNEYEIDINPFWTRFLFIIYCMSNSVNTVRGVVLYFFMFVILSILED